jgi:hypothetical protein
MTESPALQTRRGAIAASLLTSVLVATRAGAVPTDKDPSRGITGGPDDWGFLVGRWTVRHRRLKAAMRAKRSGIGQQAASAPARLSVVSSSSRATAAAPASDSSLAL